MPANENWSFLDHPGPLPFAHRGGAAEAAENTMAAFEHAVSLGYRYVETDVRASADGVPVAFHDERLERVADRAGVVAELPWSELARARVEGHAPIPRVAELLAAWPELRVVLELKDDAAVEPLAEVIAAADAIDRVCVGSFRDARIARMRQLLGPGLCVSMGPRQVAALKAASRGLPSAGLLRAPCAQVPVRWGPLTVIDRRLIATTGRLGLQLHAWTINDEAEMDRLLDLGVDGIMTDRPALLRAVLRRRGAWQ